MKPTFANANYYRDTITEREDENLYELDPKHLESIVGVHSKLLLTDANGVHIPRLFAENFDLSVWNISDRDSDITCLKDGPKNSWYWEAWDAIMGKAFMIDEYGYRWHLEQDGDLWARLEIEYQPSEEE